MKPEAKTYGHREIGQEYDAIFKTDPIKDEDRAYRWFASAVVGSVGEGRRLLDVACGGGYFLRELSGGAEGCFYGMDLSQEALVLAQKTSPQARYALGAGERLPFQSRTFDVVTCLGSLEHFLDPLEGLREMRRVLVPPGQLFVLVPNLFWYKDIGRVLWRGQRLQRNQSHEIFAVESEWKELIHNGGFRVDRVIKYNGISVAPWKQWLKDLLIPRRLSYHFIFVCSVA